MCRCLRAGTLGYKTFRLQAVFQKPEPTCHPGIEENVEVPAVFLSGPADAEGRHHGHVHLVLPHNAVCRGSDAHGHHVVGGVGDAAMPGALALAGGEDGDVGALAVLWVGT